MEAAASRASGPRPSPLPAGTRARMGRAGRLLGPDRRCVAGLARRPARRRADGRATCPRSASAGSSAWSRCAPARPGPARPPSLVAADRRRAGLRRASRPASTAWRVIAARIPRPGDPVAALAGNPQIRPLTPVPAAEDRDPAAPVAGRGRPARALPAGDTGLLLGDLKRPARPRPGPVSPPGKTPSSRSWRPGRARRPRWASRTSCPRPARSSPPATRPTCGPPPRELRAAIGRHGVAVRPAAHHRPAAALVVEPARRAGAPSRPPTGSPPTSSSPSTTTAAATCGGRPPRTCCAPCSWPPRPPGRSLRECGRWLDDAGVPDPRRAARRRRVPRPGRQRCAARRTAPRKPATASTRPPAPRRNAMQRRGHHGLGHPAARRQACRRSTRPRSRPAATPSTC